MQCDSFFEFSRHIIRLVESVREHSNRHVEGEINLHLARKLLLALKAKLAPSLWLQQAIEQLQSYVNNPAGRLSCIEISCRGLYLLVGYMQPSKAPGAHFEALLLETQEYPGIDLSSYPSKAFPARFVAGTSALENIELLGIFAEHFGYKKPSQQFWPNARAFYLVDRFQSRFDRITGPVLQASTTEDSLPNLRKWNAQASPGERHQAAAWWLALHEHFHSKGELPFHRFMEVKRNRLAAGYEETRVDLLALQELHRMKNRYPLAQVFAEYVLAERILSYTIVDLQEKNRQKITFDSVGSQLLTLKLFELGAVVFEHGKLRILEHWPAAIAKILAEFEWIERSIASEKEEPVQRERLLRYIRASVRCCAPELGRKAIHAGDQVPILDFFREANTQFSSN